MTFAEWNELLTLAQEAIRAREHVSEKRDRVLIVDDGIGPGKAAIAAMAAELGESVTPHDKVDTRARLIADLIATKQPAEEPPHVQAVRAIVKAWDDGQSFEFCCGLLESSTTSAERPTITRVEIMGHQDQPVSARCILSGCQDLTNSASNDAIEQAYQQAASAIGVVLKRGGFSDDCIRWAVEQLAEYRAAA